MMELSQRRLQRTLLARQRLLERTTESISEVLEHVSGLQSQYAPTMYIGLWSRLDGLRRADLTTALEDRVVVQGTMLRATIHLVSAADYWPLNLAVRDVRRQWYLRQRRTVDDAEMRAAAKRVRAALDRDGVMSRKELDAVAGPQATSYVGLWIDLVRVPPSGTWDRRRADLFASAESWIGLPPAMSVDDARDHLVRHYLTGFGPATLKEIASFTGASVGDIKPAAERVADRRFRAEDGTELLDLDGLPLPQEDSAAPVRFLGNWEALLLVHARRALVLREADRPRLFATTMPQSSPTFLVDGEVAGTWKYDVDRIVLAEWRPIPTRFRKDLVAEAERLADYHR